jgi:hypothetical protein
MTFASRNFAGVAAALIALGATSLASQAVAQTSSSHTFKTTLTGPAETPPGDPHGAGTATLHVEPSKGQVCYDLRVSKIATATMAHIHKGAAGQAGPVVVPLKAPDAAGKSSGCAQADSKVLADIVQNPSDYYVNVHNAPYPGGAVRGQLSK